MKNGRVVKIRFRRSYKEQLLWVFIGKLIESKDGWLGIHGKGILFNPGKTNPIDIDDTSRTLYCPRENINHVRILPDDFDLDNIKTHRKENRWYVEVDGEPCTSLGEGM